MTPYYEDHLTKLYLGDCIQVMKSLKQRFQLIVTDSPYGDTSLDWDVVKDWIPSAEAVLTTPESTIWTFGSLRSHFQSVELFTERGWKLAQDIIWEKHNGSGFHADRFKRVHEMAVQWYKGSWEALYKSPVFTNDATARTLRRKTRPTHMGNIEAGAYSSVDGGPRLMRSVIYAASCHGEAVHPTQKPTAILDPLIRYSAAPSYVVLDPFCGSGSTNFTCKRLGIKSVGIELDEKTLEAAALRLSQGVMDFEA